MARWPVTVTGPLLRLSHQSVLYSLVSDINNYDLRPSNSSCGMPLYPLVGDFVGFHSGCVLMRPESAKFNKSQPMTRSENRESSSLLLLLFQTSPTLTGPYILLKSPRSPGTWPHLITFCHFPSTICQYCRTKVL